MKQKRTEMKVLLDAGHGARDPGARDNQGNYEREQMIKLTGRVKYYLEQKGHEVVKYPDDQDSYANGDLAQWAKNNNVDQVIEFHFDIGDKGSILIYPGEPDDVDKRLNNVVNNYFGSKGIQGRGDLYNVSTLAQTGVPYRLVEVYGGWDDGDINKFNSQLDSLANDFANAIVDSNSQPVIQPENQKPTSDLVWQNGTAKVLVDTLNIRKEPNGDIVSTYSKGDTFTYDAYIDRDGIRWVSYIGSTSKQRRYVARRKLDNSQIYCDAY